MIQCIKSSGASSILFASVILIVPYPVPDYCCCIVFVLNLNIRNFTLLICTSCLLNMFYVWFPLFLEENFVKENIFQLVGALEFMNDDIELDLVISYCKNCKYF